MNNELSVDYDKQSGAAIFGLGVLMCFLLVVCIGASVKFGLTVGEARGEENIYLDCRDRGTFELHGVEFVCGVEK